MVRQLSELADRGVEFAQHLRLHVERAETPQAKARLAAAYLAIARSVRHSVALEVRLIREARGRSVLPRRRTTSRDDPDAPAAAAVPPDTVKH
ncbi:MAG: hypothetical protein ACJ798_07800 [Phenylobacterium sp.]